MRAQTVVQLHGACSTLRALCSDALALGTVAVRGGRESAGTHTRQHGNLTQHVRLVQSADLH